MPLTTAIISINNIQLQDFVVESWYVTCEVRTWCLYIILTNLRLCLPQFSVYESGNWNQTSRNIGSLHVTRILQDSPNVQSIGAHIDELSTLDNTEEEERWVWTVTYIPLLLDERQTLYDNRFHPQPPQQIFKFTHTQIITNAHVCMRVYEYRHAFHLQNIIHSCCAHRKCAHKRKSVKGMTFFFQIKQTAQIGINFRVRVFNDEMLVRSKFASGRSCDRPTRSRFFVVFFGSRANAEFVTEFSIALHDLHVVFPIVRLKFHSKVALPMLHHATFVHKVLRLGLQKTSFRTHFSVITQHLPN
jgi:hypothetical protein